MNTSVTMLAVVIRLPGKADAVIPIENVQRKLAIKKAYKLAREHPGTEYRVYVGWKSRTDRGNMSRSITVYRNESEGSVR